MAGKDISNAKVPGRSQRPAAQQGHQTVKGSSSQTVGKKSAVQSAAPKGVPNSHVYEAFLAQDPSGETIVKSAIRDMTLAVWAIHRREPATRKFPVAIENSIEVDGSIEDYPAPSMHRWTTSIGNHEIWLRGTVEIDCKRQPPHFHVAMTMTIKPLGHRRFKRYEVKRVFDFTTEEIEQGITDRTQTLEA